MFILNFFSSRYFLILIFILLSICSIFLENEAISFVYYVLGINLFLILCKNILNIKKRNKITNIFFQKRKEVEFYTDLPEENIQKGLEAIGFKTFPSNHKYDAEKHSYFGNKKWIHLILCNTGGIAVLLSIFICKDIFPPQKINHTLLKNKTLTLKEEIKTTYSKLAFSTGIQSKPTINYKSLDLKLYNIDQEVKIKSFFDTKFLLTNKIKKIFINIIKQLKSIFPLFKKKPMKKRVFIKNSLLVNLKSSDKFKQIRLNKLESYLLENKYLLTLNDISSKPEITKNGSLENEKKYFMQSYRKRNEVDGSSCLYLTYKSEKNENIYTNQCIKKGTIIPINMKEKIAFVRNKEIVSFIYQPMYGPYLFKLGVCLFIIGFIGYWWIKRYDIVIKNTFEEYKISLKGTGMNINPQKMLEKISESYSFSIPNNKKDEKENKDNLNLDDELSFDEIEFKNQVKL